MLQSSIQIQGSQPRRGCRPASQSYAFTPILTVLQNRFHDITWLPYSGTGMNILVHVEESEMPCQSTVEFNLFGRGPVISGTRPSIRSPGKPVTNSEPPVNELVNDTIGSCKPDLVQRRLKWVCSSTHVLWIYPYRQRTGNADS